MSTVFHNILRAADKRYARRFAVLGAVFLAVLLGSLLVGRYALSPGQLVQMLWTRITGGAADWPISDDKVVFAVRLPRVAAAALVGAALAVSGAAYQGMFRNPMVSPDILGASTGAGFGAAVAILLGAGYFGISAAAFCCGLLAVAAAWLVSRLSKADQAVSLILAGMMISSLFSAGTSFVKLVADTQQQLPAITYWLMGSLSSIKDKDVVFLAIPVALGMIPLFFLRWRMNLLTVGEEEAQSMGVNTRRLRGAVIVCATLLTSASVAVSGMIGWVGLVIPHFCRMLFGYDYRRLIPAGALFGAAFLLAVDDIARLVTTGELPLGILTAFVGAPLFLYLIATGGRRRVH
ncbi:MAG: iron ABC transporter permease [Oscillospiraceae bacterium]